MTERLAGRGEADLAGVAVEQLRDGRHLQSARGDVGGDAVHRGAHGRELTAADREVDRAHGRRAFARRHARRGRIDDLLDHRVLVLLWQVLVLGFPLLDQAVDHGHHRRVVEADRGDAAAHAAVVFEEDRQRGAAPGQREDGLHEARVDHVEGRVRSMGHELLFPEVVLFRAQQLDDRGRGADGDARSTATRIATEGRRLEHVDAMRLQREFGRDLGQRVHVGRGRAPPAAPPAGTVRRTGRAPRGCNLAHPWYRGGGSPP